MNTEHVFNKFSDVKNRLLHMKEKLTRHDEERFTEDKKNVEEEIRYYQKDHPAEPQEKVLRESGGQDISAI